MVDYYTRFMWVFFLRIELETTSDLINFIKGIEILTMLPIWRTRSENGPEFTNATHERFHTVKGIEYNVFAPYTRQQNVVV